MRDARRRRFEARDRCACLLAAVLAAVGCGERFLFILDDRADAATGAADSNRSDDPDPAMPWGRYAAGLDVPACPASPSAPLVVDTATDELEAEDLSDPAQAGPALSLREALFIAANRPGFDAILFDAGTFPADAPTTIHLEGEMPANAEAFCLDGRDRGVILRWTAAGFDCGPRCVFGLRDGSLMVGLTLRNLPYRLTVSDSRVAGCRIGTDGTSVDTQSGSFWALQTSGDAFIGPGNVFAGPATGVRVLDSMASGITLVHTNDFGFDPLTRAVLPADGGVAVDSDASVLNCLFALTAAPVYFQTQSSTLLFYFTANRIGIDRDGALLTGPDGDWHGVDANAWSLTAVESNVIRGAGYAVRGQAKISANSISGNRQGIVFAGEPPHAPPIVTRVAPDRVEGTCPTRGQVEVFSDPADQGEVYLGYDLCEAGEAWSVSATVPEGRNVTATLTVDNRVTSAFSAPCRAFSECP